MEIQLAGYEAPILRKTVTSLSRDDNGIYSVTFDGSANRATHVILATGVVDLEPPLANVFDAVRRGLPAMPRLRWL